MPIAGIRGATTAHADTGPAILEATRELLEEIVARNALAPGEIVSVVFAVTHDLTSAYPARAARDMGWTSVPLLCTAAQHVTGSPERCVRVLVHVTRRAGSPEAAHVYLRGARALRPDLVDD